jgi:hypothetical protein
MYLYSVVKERSGRHHTDGVTINVENLWGIRIEAERGGGAQSPAHEPTNVDSFFLTCSRIVAECIELTVEI